MITEDGDYLSNLKAPDLRPLFRHLTWRKMPHSMGHLVASDWADKAVDDPVFGLYKNCGLWTRDEAAILYYVAAREGSLGWIDIGAHTGWTTSHISESATSAFAIDPMLAVPEFEERFCLNWSGHASVKQIGLTSEAWFDSIPGKLVASGFIIDGDHEPGKPLEDAQNAAKHLADTGVILFHDFLGQPVREAVTWLLDQGFKARVYWTPHMVACCWRGDFTPPEHDADPRIDWSAHKAEMWRDFDFGRLS